MIRASRSMVLASAATALALHGAGLWVSDPRGKIEIEGGAGAVEAMLGSSFADMVAGAAQPVSDSTVTASRQTEQVVSPEQPGAALRPDTPETPRTPPPRRAKAARMETHAEAVQPEETTAVTPPEETTQADAPGEVAQTAAPEETARNTPTEAAVPTESAAMIEAALPETTAKPAQATDLARKPETETTAEPLAPAATAKRAAPARTEVTARPVRHQAAHGVTVEKATPPAEPEVAEAVPETEERLQVSRRPQARPREIEPAAARQAPEPERKTEVRGNSGSNAARDATRGSASGTRSATAARQGRDTASRSDAQGNAAASNYPGLVMRHLARVPRPRANARGAALVQFAIAEDGALASVRIASSSGSPGLDQAALSVVQRAAPFPDPPRGALRNFSVRIKGQ